MPFKLISKFKPKGDQPQAIAKLVKNLENNIKHQVLLGVTGCGKTFDMANVISSVQKPVLIISHNKTLAAQTYQEFKEFFPHNAVHYFVSYYDYYQPEAYIPQTDTYIEKDSRINEEIDRLRHAAIQDVLTRNDVVVVASVSCIYNIGSPESYQAVSLEIKEGQRIARNEFLGRLTSLQYQRNEIEFTPGSFRVRGDLVEVYLVTGSQVFSIEFEYNKVKTISLRPARNGLDGQDPHQKTKLESLHLFPAHLWVTPEDKLTIAMENIRLELQEQIAHFKKQGKLLEAERIEQRTRYDLEMLEETGYCHSIENYSRHLEFRKPGEAPFTLLDYFRHAFGKDFIVLIDESHMTVPQLRAMAVQDRIRKQPLVEYGFRLPSAVDNRPLGFQEFEERITQAIYISATPSSYELEKTLRQGKAGKQYLIEQLIRPTGLLEPSVEIKSTENQLKDLVKQIEIRVAKKQRTLVLTLTKRLAEAVSEYLVDHGVKTQWMHAEIKTLERPEILRNLRLGKYDVLVGINLLREGLDLPEVALVAILDADKEGFLRNTTTLIQTMGRAARHPEGHIILYADKTTFSMQQAIAEIKRRRKIQAAYNKTHHITPTPIIKEVREWLFGNKEKEVLSEFWMVRDKKLLQQEMREVAKNLDFERAAEIRDLIKKLK